MRRVAQRRRMRRVFLVLLGLLLLVGLVDDPASYDPQPGRNAPAYVNWRTGEVVDPSQP